MITDLDGASVSTVVEVSVTPVNDDPAAAECDPTSVVNNAEIEFDPRVCGSDIDGDELAVVQESLEATNGTAAVVDGMVVFTPAAGFVGQAEVRFLLSDGEGEPAESSIQVEVTSPYVGVSGQDGQLVRIYSAMLGRLPDDQGFAYWTEMMDQGVQLPDLVTYFGTSEEFGNTYGDRLLEDTNEEWIEFVYGEILDRGSDEAGKAFTWTCLIAVRQLASKSWSSSPSLRNTSCRPRPASNSLSWRPRRCRCPAGGGTFGLFGPNAS